MNGVAFLSLEKIDEGAAFLSKSLPTLVDLETHPKAADFLKYFMFTYFGTRNHGGLDSHPPRHFYHCHPSKGTLVPPATSGMFMSVL